MAARGGGTSRPQPAGAAPAPHQCAVTGSTNGPDIVSKGPEGSRMTEPARRSRRRWEDRPSEPKQRRRSAAPRGSEKLGLYLRRLRQGYGYSLRKVEEKARQQGGEIDNSQLSRYEKGLCYPSFDKLRTLARIFNVSIQTFSDVVDLEELERHAPESDDVDEILRDARAARAVGEYGRAYAHYQKARQLLEERGEGDTPAAARVRLSCAITLYLMRKISLAEYELRQLLRHEDRLDDGLKVRALLELSNVHASFGDYLLAEIEAERSMELARRSGQRSLEAFAHHCLGRILQDRGRLDEALEHWHEALKRYRELGNVKEALKVKRNLGLLYGARGQFHEGVRLLKEAQEEARKAGHRWTVASAGACLAELYYHRGNYDIARRYMTQSNAIASSGDVQYVDILFLNAFYLWRIAEAEGNATEARVALGRLKYLRPHLEQELPEVREFDQYIQKGGGR
ncbi:MAG: tetratricopeptide repeat protein [Acidobacteria bacterium]|nr:MAG: tetratricopeptide repeat protein [Acidobacteriota bacterium]